MRAPFYTPLRNPRENTPESIVASLMWLQSMSGDELELFNHPLKVQIQAIWALKNGYSQSLDYLIF